LANLLFIFFSAEAKKPNILLIFSDDHAKKALSCYGNQDIQTPALDRIANEGMRFEHALTPNSFCTPARAAALTGKYSHRNGVTHLNQRFDGSQQTFPKLLQKQDMRPLFSASGTFSPALPVLIIFASKKCRANHGTPMYLSPIMNGLTGAQKTKEKH
jgi:hypothetical protein